MLISRKLHNLRHIQRKLIATLVLFLFLIYLTKPKADDLFSRYYYHFLNPKAGIQCYRNKTQRTLPDVSELGPERAPPPGTSIFFHETSCNSHFAGKIVVNARQACAVESAARLHPNRQTFLLFASTGELKLEDKMESDRFLAALLSYDNVNIRHVNFEKYSNNSPVEDLYRRGALDDSGYAQSHASDLLRYLTLWKYGGIYLDLDVIVVKSLEDLGTNYAGIESDTVVAAGILNFEPSGFGHELVSECLNDLKHNFQGHDWGNNGPGVITRMLQRVCHEDSPAKMVEKRCEGGFVVHSPEKFYPIEWRNWSMYFNEDFSEHVTNQAQNSYLIHVWNKHSAGEKLPIRSQAAYSVYAQKYCPRVYQEVDEFF